MRNAEKLKNNSGLTILFPRVILYFLLLGWTFFCYGLLLEYIDIIGNVGNVLFWFFSPLVFIIIYKILNSNSYRWWPYLKEELERYADIVDSFSDNHIWLWIILAASLCLYTELMIIRLHTSFFRLFAYFKNISLLSCFLGLGIGYLKGAKRPLLFPLALPLLVIQIVLMHVLRFCGVSSLLQYPIAEQLTIEIAQSRGTVNILLVYGFFIFVFVLNALCFIPLGQLVSRLMLRNKKLIAYSWNLVGSLLGVLLFVLLSFLWTPPHVWLFLATLGFIVFLYRHKFFLFITALSGIILVGSLGTSLSLNELDVYSPYQTVTLRFQRESKQHAPLTLLVNKSYFQRLLNLNPQDIQNNNYFKRYAEYYALPYYFKAAPEDVLVVGSGAGNDVAAAIRHNASSIDAVEIDPAILCFGKMFHPESPYQSRSVNIINDDARAYIRNTSNRYDLIVYGLLDSHTLLSSRSGVRLDSYIYTLEAFREMRTKLKRGGIICLTFSLLSDQLGRKIFLMLKQAFNGQEPLVFKTGYDGGYAFLIGEQQLQDYSLPLSPFLSNVTSRFSSSRQHVDVSTDNWPFFYMPVKRYPLSYMFLLLVLLVVSVVFICQYTPILGRNFSLPCFFLGAGFMLIETKGITELALVYGSTWIVVSIVIASVIIMAFLANLFVMRMFIPRPLIAYLFLFLSLGAGLFLSSDNLVKFNPWLSRIIMTTILMLPLFFSGFVFSTELRKVGTIAIGLSSNLLGAMVGGFLEYNSMYFGYKSLYFIAFVMYGCAFLSSYKYIRNR